MAQYLVHRGNRDTIFAPASGVGRAAVVIVRVSGPGCEAALHALAPEAPFGDRRATLRSLRDPQNGELLDRALVLSFIGPRSFTGEDLVELHATGGRAVLSGILTALASLPGLRPGEPGEFTWRAFANGKLDLSEVEGLADLVDAETASQRRQALRLAGGALSREAESISAILLDGMSTLETLLDFADVEDKNFPSLDAVLAGAKDALSRIEGLLTCGKAGVRLREGLVIVIAGAVNAGKSTLVNTLAQRSVSIVSDVPGTTRDLVEVSLELGGFPVTLVDTAGIRDTEDPVEREGVSRARRRSLEADLTLWLIQADSLSEQFEEPGQPFIRVVTKVDAFGWSESSDMIAISARTGKGIDGLISFISRFAAEQFNGVSGSLISAERHFVALDDARSALERVLHANPEAVELMAEDFRLAARALERIGGRIDVEDVLGSIFGRLCVGK